MLSRNQVQKDERSTRLSVSDVNVYEDPFTYFANVIRKKIVVQEHGLYSLQNNITVMKILEAAKESSRTGKTVLLKK
jgi:predicted dehydrogenase